MLAAQPIVSGTLVYEGSWDGFLYALSTADGHVVWQRDLGQTTSPRCVPPTAGITSAAAVTTDTLYIGGGDHYLYALDPATGAVRWRFSTGDNSPTGGAYNWASPVVSGGRVLYGIAAFCDNPFPPGVLWRLDAASGALQQTVHFLPDGIGGGGLWTSPSVDPTTGAIFVTTASGDFYVPHAYSLARLDPATLQVVDAWQIPTDEQVFDGDWGTTPTLFADAAGRRLVGAAAKNGKYYAFDAAHLAAGPIWTARIADGGQCPQCGEGAIASSAFAYGTVYVAAGYQAIGEAQKAPGTVRALDPATGAVRWTHVTAGPVIPAVSVANGLVVAAGGDTVEVLDAASGALLWDDATEGTIYAAPSIADGVLYVASTDGWLYAFSAAPYPAAPTPYPVAAVGGNPPPFTIYHTPVPAPPLPAPTQCFAAGAPCTGGAFLAFWQAQGGLDRFGPPISGPLLEAGRLVQYFRNAVLALHPAPAGGAPTVQIAALDPHLDYSGATDPAFAGAAPQPGATYVPESHHNLSDPFLAYWQAHGSVAALGYPVSEPFDEYNVIDGQVRRVQYFERARLEVVTAADGSSQVGIGALGLPQYRARYGRLP